MGLQREGQDLATKQQRQLWFIQMGRCSHKGSYKTEADVQKAEKWREDGNRGNARQCDVEPQAKEWRQCLLGRTESDATEVT